MATLEKIRNKAGLLVIVVGVALFAFIIGDFLNSGSAFFRQSHEKVADVNGTVIKIQDYQQRVDEMTQVYKNQSGSNSVPEEIMTNIRQSVFDGMVQEIVVDEAAEKLGLTVSSQELFDMVQGENISPVILQMGMFNNPQTGMFDKNALLEYLKLINVDDASLNSYPEAQREQILQAKYFWLFVERNMKRERLESKYTTLLAKAISYNALDAKAAFDESAESSDIAYVMQSYATIPDSTVSVNRDDVKKLYEQRKESFKQKESKVIKYIAVDINPSQDDYTETSRDIEALKDEFVTSDNVAALVNDKSDKGYLDAYVSAAGLTPEVRQFVTAAEVGEVYGPVFENNTYNMYKLVDKTVAPDSVRLAQILLPRGNGEADFVHFVDSLVNELSKGADFAEAAGMYSMDQQTAPMGGEIGWATEAMIASSPLGDEFKNAVFAAPAANKVVVANSMYYTHIIKIQEKTRDVAKYKVADIEMTVSPSSATYNNLYNDLNQFISKNRDMDKWEEAAKEAGYTVRTATLTANDQMVGVIANSRPVVRWAFQSSKGKVSDIIESGNTFVVAGLEGTIKEGYRRFESVENSLKSELVAQKKGELISSDLLAKNLSSLDGYAGAIDSRVDTVRFVSFNTRRITGIGVEPKINAAVALAPVGQLSKPVAGASGVYVFDVFNRNEENKEFDAEEQINTLNASNFYRFGYQTIQTLVNKANVEDNRIRFY